MSVWFAIPSARPVAEAQACIDAWRAKGYRVAIWRDTGAEPVECDLLMSGEYAGYAKTVNLLAKTILAEDPAAEWIVTGGDDTLPDGRPASEIAAECSAHFSGTFGVMQPTGDRWADGSIDRIAGSPWLGREFCERAYQGNGPLWGEFTHMFVDEHLQAVAVTLGLFWQRRDVTHYHNHYLRVQEGVNWSAGVPAHLTQWSSQQHWNESKAIFERLQAGGFAEAFDLRTGHGV